MSTREEVIETVAVDVEDDTPSPPPPAAASTDTEDAPYTEERLAAMRDEKDFYKLLGLKDTASADDVGASYKRLAIKVHPDKHTGSDLQPMYKQAFETLAIAKKTLTDPQQRRVYDLKRGTASVAGKWSFEAMKERRKDVREDYRKLDYELYLDTQLQRAEIYQKKHEADKVHAFGTIFREVRTEVLDTMRTEGWDRARASVYASEQVGKTVSPAEIDEWVELEKRPKAAAEEDEGMSRAELEAASEHIDAKGRFKGFASYEEMSAFYGGARKEAFRAPVEINQKAGAGLQAAIQAAREEKAADEAAAKEREAASLAADEEERKAKAKRRAEAAFESRGGAAAAGEGGVPPAQRCRVDTDTEGFAVVADAVAKPAVARRAPGAAGGVGAVLGMLRKCADDDSDSSESGGGGFGGLGGLGGYGSD